MPRASGLARRTLRRARGFRGRYECPCCETRLRRFITGGFPTAVICPVCRSRPRQRLLWCYLRDRVRQSSHLRILHVAPDRATAPLLRALAADYVSVDIETGLEPTLIADLTALPLEDERFDLVLCSHVLEHIPDDRAAMAELHRVLDPGGTALIQCPVDYDSPATFEDPSIRDPETRRRLFSQDDHVRVYGPDLKQRLEGAGFGVEVTSPADGMRPDLVERFGLVPRVASLRNDIYVCRKVNRRR